MQRFTIASLNVRGLRNYARRAKYYEYFDYNNIDILAIQETHVDEKLIPDVKREWHGKSRWVGGATFERGVAFLFKPGLHIKILKQQNDAVGRIL